MHIKLRKWVKIVLFIIILVSLFFIYSKYFGTNGLIVKEYGVVDSRLPNNFYGLKIVQISDIHYKVTTTKEELKSTVNEINLLKPDIVILSGDLFDNSIEYSNKDYKDLINILGNINYNIGKFAIKGEHDLNIKEWENVINDSNFINLNDNYEKIYYNGLDPILLIGISSNYKKNHIEKSLENIYKEINEDIKYSILVLHEPDFIDKIEYSKFNLILAGHSHNGEINLPFIGGIIKNNYYKKYYKEYYELENTKLYISSGIGTSKYKLRFLNKPSFNLYRLTDN